MMQQRKINKKTKMKWKRKILKILKAKNYNIAEQKKKKKDLI